MAALRILLIDDAADDRALVRRHLQREFPDVQVLDVTTQEQLDAALKHGQFDLAITDYLVRWSDGVRVLKDLKAEHPATPVIMFTGSGTEETAVEAMKAGLDDYVVKSSKGYVGLAATVRTVLERHDSLKRVGQSEAELRRLNLHLERLVRERTEELEHARADLERKVQERTHELSEKVHELELFQQATVGRELKMIELERELESYRRTKPPLIGPP